MDKKDGAEKYESFIDSYNYAFHFNFEGHFRLLSFHIYDLLPFVI
jgi:hypothetical protein